MISAVHTTGFNWESLGALSAYFTFVISVMGKLVMNGIGGVVEKKLLPIVKRLETLETRMARLEGIEEGKQMILDQQKGARENK